MTAYVSIAETAMTAQSAPPKVLRNATSSTQVMHAKRLTLKDKDNEI